MLRWQGRAGEYDACISNVSLEGCFLNTQGEAEIGDLISFKAHLPTDELIELRGKVVHRQARPIGFGLRFEGLSSTEQMFLKLLIADADNISA
jgi:PilZ domain